MQAMILNSGTGSRMGKRCEDRPKCLLTLKNGETILSRQIKTLISIGVTEIIVTTGFWHDKIKSELDKEVGNATFITVKNPDYAATNYIYSMELAKNFVREELFLLHGDLVYDQSILESLAGDRRKNLLLTSKNLPLPKKDFKARVKDGYVKGVSVTYDKDCYFCLPLYKLSYETAKTWLNEISRFVEQGKTNVYAEEALNEISDKLKIEPYYFEGFCMEVDCEEDYEMVLSELN